MVDPNSSPFSASLPSSYHGQSMFSYPLTLNLSMWFALANTMWLPVTTCQLEPLMFSRTSTIKMLLLKSCCPSGLGPRMSKYGAQPPSWLAALQWVTERPQLPQLEAQPPTWAQLRPVKFQPTCIQMKILKIIALLRYRVVGWFCYIAIVDY